MVDVLSTCLWLEGTIVLFSGFPVEMFNGKSTSYDVLKVLADDDAGNTFMAGEQQWLPPGIDRGAWITWIREYRCPQDLKIRATELVEQVDHILAAHHAQVAANRTLAVIAYPLTVGGMLLVVLSFGHLLSFQPMFGGEGKTDSSPLTLRAVRKTLMLLAASAALDLTWTILVSRTGSMKELNPLGSALINDPQSLIILKVVATSVAVGILSALKRHRIAQKGSWWGCLVYTLLIARWLTFNSMFIS